MKKYKVYINGFKTVLADTEDQAIQNTEDILDGVHYSLNLDVSGIKEQ